MRVWVVSPALLALAGCAAGGFTYVESAPPRPAPDPETLAKRLEAMQPDWPEPRRLDCDRTGCVALTFDDGPGRHTGRLLDVLRAREVKATFFVVGEMVAAGRGAERVRQMVADGHELGNHSWSHRQLTTLPKHRIRRQLQRTDQVVRALTGVRMRLMRPPYGSTDRRVAALTRRRGQAQILWNVDTFDWRDRVPAVVARRGAKAEPGSIVLMHDIHRTTVKAIPDLLDRLTRKGYAFATVSELYGRWPKPGKKYEDDIRAPLAEDRR
ncbi:polysaccharide deacetylase family protein [Nonomuraea sp. ZG12]|uniref:polysaccharide deacetylase family protein n=1 Tax=Nonomuraea sp. ZG12 TaxID=3452207 RepID=UPI003F88D1EA